MKPAWRHGTGFGWPWLALASSAHRRGMVSNDVPRISIPSRQQAREVTGAIETDWLHSRHSPRDNLEQATATMCPGTATCRASPAELGGARVGLWLDNRISRRLLDSKLHTRQKNENRGLAEP